MSSIRINVAQRHIDQGECKSPQRCAIAAAIREEYDDVSYVAVRTSGITITSRGADGSGFRWHFAVPTKAAKSIVAFDAGEPVAPFQFTAKAVDGRCLKPLTPTQREKNREWQRAKRARTGTSTSHRGRVAGV